MIAWMVLVLGAALAADTPPAAAPAPEPAAAPAPAPDAPDRSGPPPVEAPVPMKLPEPVVWQVSPGVRAEVVTVPGVRKVSGAVWLGRGCLDLDGTVTDACVMTGALQDVATVDYDSDALEIAEDLDDTSVTSTEFGLRRAAISFETPHEKLLTGLGLLTEVIRSPTFPGREVRQGCLQRSYWFTTQGPADLQSVAGQLMTYGWYPEDSPWGPRPDPLATIRIKPRDLRDRYGRLLAQAPITVMLVGDVERADIQDALAKAFAGVGVAGDKAPDPPFQPTPGTRVLAADMPGQAQAVVMVRTDAPGRGDADRLAFKVVDWALGGHFLSRLNANLREDKGYTYGAGSRYAIHETHGTWTARATVKSENLGASITEIGKEIARARDGGLRADEIDGAWKEWVGNWNTVQQTSNSAFQFYGHLSECGRSLDRARAELDTVEAMKPETTEAVARKWLAADGPWLWVVVGDRKEIEPQLKAQGLDVTWVSPQNAVTGAF